MPQPHLLFGHILFYTHINLLFQKSKESPHNLCKSLLQIYNEFEAIHGDGALMGSGNHFNIQHKRYYRSTFGFIQYFHWCFHFFYICIQTESSLRAEMSLW